jgi:all-trans-8'-apo-beta-carotenal 15,15'-oxygenase
VPDHAPFLERLFESEAPEASYPLTRVEGEIPSYVRGTYYLNGPGLFRRGDLDYRHWLDGDGRVSALRFGDDGVTLTTRFVAGPRRRDEEAAGRALYRAFGTTFDGDRLVRGIGLASPVNVSIYRWGGRLLALGEQGLPWSLDPESLETLGEETFGRLSPVSPFAAHPHLDPESGEMVCFGISYAAQRPLLYLYHLHPEKGVVARRRLLLDAPYSLHDFSLSPRYASFYLAPYLLDMEALLEGGVSVQEALSWQPQRGTRLLVVSRETGQEVASIPVGQAYSLHQINAFEDEEGRLVVDLLEMSEPAYPQYEVVPDLFTTVPPARPVRLVVDPARGELVERRELPFDLAADFPGVAPRAVGKPYRRFWMLAISKTDERGRKFFDQLVAFDWDQGGVVSTYQTRPFQYLGGEPVFVADPADPGRGVILVQLLDAGRGRGSFALFDASDVAAGPVARLHLEAMIPPGFHASFAPEASHGGG